MKHIKLLITALAILLPVLMWAQGPPIRTDKPIMLGENKGTVRTFYQYFRNEGNHYHVVPLMIDYNLKNNIEIGIEMPFAAISGANRMEGFRAGDLMLRGKYQFVRKDGMGKTFRMAAKAIGMFPTGRPSEVPHVGMGVYQTFLGLLAGMESLKYGVIGELGYNAFSEIHPGFVESRLSFGLPLLKQVYPVKQVTLYFEYEGRWMPTTGDHAAYFSQGVQYAFKSYAIEASFQMPLVQNVPVHFRRDLAILIGGRFVI